MTRRVAPLVLASALLALPAAATDVPVDYTLEMEAVFLGLTVAQVSIAAGDVEGELAQQFSVETQGLVRDVSGFRSAGSAVSRLDDTGFSTLRFDTSSENKRATREVVVRYDDAGRVVELATYKRDQLQRSEVPADLRDHTIDPLTAIPAIRRWLATARDETERAATRFAVFDGRRRYDLEVAITDRRVAEFAQGPTPILEVAIVLVPLAGFDADDDNGGRREVVALISDDADVLPLIMRTGARGGLQASLYTRSACTGAEPAVCRDFRY